MCVQITCEQVKEFTQTISTFHDKFSEEGPGTVGNNLDEGMCILYVYVCMYVYIYVCACILCAHIYVILFVKV